MSSLLPKVLVPLLLLGHEPPAAVAEELSSFSALNSPWLPTQDRKLVSPNRTFAAGFVSSGSRFIFAVWVQKSSARTKVWSLLSDVGPSSALTISSGGVLSLNNSSGNVWPNATALSSNTSMLVLREDGSLVFDKGSSFASPTDTMLASQNFSADKTLTARNYQLTHARTLVFNSSAIYWNASTSTSTSATIRNFTSDVSRTMS